MIEVKPIADGEAFVILVDTPESIALFKEMVQRATNLWPDAQPEIKEFADIITNGKVFQHYRGQASNKIHTVRYTCKHDWDENLICTKCGVRMEQLKRDEENSKRQER